MSDGSPIAIAEKRQRLASRPRASVWVSASAGTGKTKVLTDRVLRLLLDGTPPHRILCLTFTKAAAAEMARRINDRLLAWASGPRDRLVDQLLDLDGAPPDDKRIARARRLLFRLIEAPAGLQIETIHAFCQSVLRRFPIEAGIAPHFDILDERTTAEVLHDAKERLLAGLDSDERLRESVGVLAGHLHEADFDDLMQIVVAERGCLADLLHRSGSVAALVDRIEERLGLPRGHGEIDLLRSACGEDAFDGPSLRRAVAALENGKKTDIERAQKIRAWLEDRDSRVEKFDTYCSAFLKKSDGGIPTRLATKDVADADPDVPGIMLAEAERLLRVRAQRAVRIAADATGALIGVGRGLLEVYGRHKSGRAGLDYDDLILAARNLLRQSGAVSWVMYKLDEGIDHILIDEAQDTNPEQWEIVRALAEDFHAGAGRAGPGERTIFAVGDYKQSIFGFQRADPAGFEAAREHFREASRRAGGEWDEIALDISFRSAPAVLRAVDAVFGRDEARRGVAEPGAEAIRHEAARLGQAGTVEIWPPASPDDEDAGDIWSPAGPATARTSPQGRVARLVAARVRDWLDRGEILESRGRPIDPGDVMVLVRRRGPFVEDLIRELKQRDVPVAGADRLVLTDQLAVMDLMAFGAFCLMPLDDLNLAAVLKSPLVGLSEDRLFALAHGRGTEPLWTTLVRRRAEGPEFARAHAVLSAALARADFVPPYEFFAGLLGADGGRVRLVGRLGAEAADPIDEFLSLALAYERSHVPSLQGFLAWIQRGRSEIKRDLEQGGRSQVRVMTVHGAKGLQAPIVFLPDTRQVPREGSGRLLWDDDIVLWSPRQAYEGELAEKLRNDMNVRAQDEYRRLLYVAMTRAEDRLYVCGWDTRKQAPDGTWYDHIREGLCPIAAPFDFDAGAWMADGWTGTGLHLSAAQSAPPDRPERPAEVIAPPALPDWIARPAPTEPAPSRPLAPSRPDREDPAPVSPTGGEDGSRFRRGLVVHRLLELLPPLPAGKRVPACRAWLARHAHDLSAAWRAEVAGETLAILNHPDFADLFGPGSRAEVPLAGVVGDRVISGQVDRLIVRDGDVAVVDYKTNRPMPEDGAGTAPAYLSQMAAYRTILREIFPDRRIRCLLLWTAGPRLMELEDDLLDRHAP